MTRVFPAPAYDALQQMADKHGGIGGGLFFDKSCAPYCVLGFASDQSLTWDRRKSIFAAIADAGIGVIENDEAVRRINRRRSFLRSLFGGSERRVPFADWCAELGVERGA